MARVDPFTYEIIRSGFFAIAKEQFAVTVRSAWSVDFALGEDFSPALLDETGKLVAQAQATPVHIGPMSLVIAAALKKYKTFQQGDVLVHNDPYIGGLHIPDILVARPMYVGDIMVGFACNRGHHNDMGGMAPSGYAGNATEVFQEGMRLSLLKLYEGGKLNTGLKEFFLANIRTPREGWGDIQAQIASCISAERRLVALCEKFGLETVIECMELSIKEKHEYFQGRIDDTIPDGQYEAEEWMDDDGIADPPKPYRIKVKITKKKGQRILFDYDGTSEQAQGPLNSSFSATVAMSTVPLIQLLDPLGEVNQGIYDCIDINAPLGTIVNPRPPAPTMLSTGDVGGAIANVVHKALAPAIPQMAIAETHTSVHNLTAGWSNGAGHVMYDFLSAGWGARSDKDGYSTTVHHTANVANNPVEAFERRYPLLIERLELMTDSGGPGKYRGGLGLQKWYRFLRDGRLSAIANRHDPRFAAQGVFGGKPGMIGAFYVIRDGRQYSMTELFKTPSRSKFGNVAIKKDDIVVSLLGGGGGYGNPRERNHELIRHDLRCGYISSESAVKEYGFEDLASTECLVEKTPLEARFRLDET